MNWKSTYSKFFIVFCCVLLAPFLLSAQDDKWVEESDIEDAELVIEKTKKLTLPRASRKFEKMKALTRPNDGSDEVKYQLRLINYSLEDIDPSIRVKKMQKEALDKLYGNYVKAGFGNFITPYLEGYFNSKRNEKYLYGLGFKHLSSRNGPIHGQNSGSSLTNIAAYGKYIFDYAAVTGKLGFERRGTRFYGYDDLFADIEVDSIRQNFNDFSASVALTGTGGKRSPISYSATADLNLFSDRFHDLSELNLDINLGGEYELSDEGNISFNVNPIFSNYQYGDNDRINRGIIKAGGAFHYLQEGLELKIGARLAYNLDSTTNLSRFTVYPDIHVNYALVEDAVSVFAKAEGDLRQQNFRENTVENPFLADTVTLRHTHNIVDLALGVQFTPIEKLGIRLQGGYGLNKNFQYFANDFAVDSAQFRTVYDSGTTGVFNFTGEVSLTFSNFRTVLRSTFFNYNTDNIAEAIHLPTLDNSLLVTYNYRNKVFFNLDLFHIGGLQALDASGNTFDLDDIVDLNFKVDYLFSDVFSAFISAKNILGREYERYYRYPVRGVGVMAGVTYAF